MNRRSFIISSGAAIGGATATFGLIQRPAIALDFTLGNVPQPESGDGDGIDTLSDVSTVDVSFNKFNVKPQYLETGNSSNPLTINIDVSISDSSGEIGSQSDTIEKTSFNNGEFNDFSGDTSTISITNVSTSESSISGDVKVTVSNNDLPSDETYNQEFYISNDQVLDNIVTRYGEATNLFNTYEKEVIEDPNNTSGSSTTVDYLEGLLSYHVGSTGGFVTSIKKREAIPRDSKNNRVSRESVIKYSTGDHTTTNYNTSS